MRMLICPWCHRPGENRFPSPDEYQSASVRASASREGRRPIAITVVACIGGLSSVESYKLPRSAFVVLEQCRRLNSPKNDIAGHA
jgi:hypothetical protein